ncbi:iron chelate uptake ABC transporter family permease subunit [Pseudooceanicola sp. CBS1P-1]|uniref:Iron chelate uptake ABC transporter family permease subunit n=1 Tax=Pseudooceanicola albus TaxID=2692189 RepID=A0A6L7G223_9RHOB|nr:MULTISPECIES: iron chelate uptake ABC transporter family permease subunit [Pseudooceanicola]MBT9384944.1 iron chelate uptake ABC transporter family permease subunit [Pseudooceanicola endophyticus]MXN18061.1 iron chelate uptake ABC transporter family permease subunit [Pseudooceanicola albus]
MAKRLIALAAVLVAVSALYMLVDAQGAWSFLLPFRAQKLGAMLLVGTCLSVATVLFQTITANRILTPSVMGFDALYILVLTSVVHLFGSAGFAAIPSVVLFAINVTGMTLLGLLLFTLLRRGARGDMMRLVLTGIILGILLRSITEFLQRMIDPSEFSVVQSISFARFTSVDPKLLALTAAVTVPVLWLAWRMRARLDVLGLGEVPATGLGERPARGQAQALVLICLLVAAATALVGPMSGGGGGPANFFGLIATALAHVLTPTERHSTLIPSAALTGCILLVAGQTVMERFLDLSTPLTVVIELIGGLLFLFLLVKRRRA